MNELKTAAGSWARAFLVAVISMAAAGVTDPKALVAAGVASILPPVLRYLNVNDPALGMKKWANQTSLLFTWLLLQC